MARLLPDSEILWCLKHFNSLQSKLCCADVSILHSNRQWSIVSLFILQYLQRGDRGIEPLELESLYENARKFSPSLFGYGVNLQVAL